MVIELSDANFIEEVIKNEGVVLVDFWAPWCGPCQIMSPIIEEVSAELSGKVKVAKLNVDENTTTAAQYSIMSIPTLIIFKNGKKEKQMVGLQSKEKIISDINQLLNS